MVLCVTANEIIKTDTAALTYTSTDELGVLTLFRSLGASGFCANFEKIDTK